MADLRLTRVGGFIFNGVTVNNTNNIVLIDVNRNATPNNSVGYRQIDVLIGIYATTVQERRLKQRELLKQLIGIESQLVFLDDPNVYYEAIVNGEILVNEGGIYTEITIPFKASKYMYGISHTPIDLIVKSDITQSVTNDGNYKASPVITLSGNASSLFFYTPNESFSINNITNETIIINTENMVVYSYEGNNKASKLQKFRGNFPYIQVGTSTISITGSGLNLEVNIDFKDTYIV